MVGAPTRPLAAPARCWFQNRRRRRSLGNDTQRGALGAEQFRKTGCHLMRNNIVAVAILAAAAGAPVAARAQTVGVAPGTSVIVEGAPGIAVESYPAFREYVIGERIPNHTIPGSVA